MKKWEEEFNKILDVVLASDFVKTAREHRDVQSEIGFHGCPNRDTAFELELLEDFFEEDIEEVWKIDEVWQWFSNGIKDALEGLWLDKDFVLERLNSKGYICSEKTVYEMLDSLCSELRAIYSKRLDSKWAGKTPLEVIRKLKHDRVYIALLDKNGLVTREPEPITINMEAKVTWKIKEEERTMRFLGKVKERNVIATIDPPVKTDHGEYSQRAIRLRENEVKATVIKT